MKRLAISNVAVVALSVAIAALPAQSQSKSAEAQQDTIKVHGHWTIEIRNLDGSVASHHEFENSLFKGDGDIFLASILSRTMSNGTWSIGLESSSNSTNPCKSSSGPTQCDILEPNGNVLSGEEGFPNLTVQLANSKNQVLLSGSATSTNGGQISSVSTYVSACPSSMAPTSCGQSASGIHRLTIHSLTTPITVQAGQSINVTVTISFS